MKNIKKNAFYAQSGGVTSVINASACGVIQAARKHKKYINKLYAGRNGILGALNQDLIDTSFESNSDIENLKYTLSGKYDWFLPVVGFLLIIFSYIYFDKYMIHPSHLTLSPILGTFMIIHFITFMNINSIINIKY